MKFLVIAEKRRSIEAQEHYVVPRERDLSLDLALGPLEFTILNLMLLHFRLFLASYGCQILSFEHLSLNTCSCHFIMPISLHLKTQLQVVMS